MDGLELLERYAKGRREFPGERLAGAKLGHANLSGADLSAADLRGADLHEAVLRNVNMRAVKLARANLSDADLRGAKLYGATLCGANLHGAYLSVADLDQADLRGADLSSASLHDVTLSSADLHGANLRKANLSAATLTRTNLREADLRSADLSGTRLIGADLLGANLVGVNLDSTTFIKIDLGPIVRAAVRHSGPSHVDWSTVLASVSEPLLKDFLRQAGVPDVFVEFMVACAESLKPNVVFSLLQSTFISYGGPDEAFARKLNGALKRQGVTTFFFKDDAPPGERLHRVMRKGVNDHDRTILICSEASLQRPGLLNELEETLAREARDGGQTYLIPVRLDDHVINGWSPAKADLAQTVRDRVIADFRRHDIDAEFDAGVAKLIAVLMKPIVHP